MSAAEVWNSDLQCVLLSIEVTAPGVLRLNLPEDHCPSMGGAIRLACAVMPDVRHIDVWAGNEPDTVFFMKQLSQWIAVDRGRPRRTGGSMRNAPMTEANGARKGEAVDSLILAARADVRHTRVLAREVQALHDHVVRLLRQLNPVRCTTITEAAQ
jgi:hypothetical protein